MNLRQLRAQRKGDRAAEKAQVTFQEVQAYCNHPVVVKQTRKVWRRVQGLLTGKFNSIEDVTVVPIFSARADTVNRFRNCLRENTKNNTLVSGWDTESCCNSVCSRRWNTKNRGRGMRYCRYNIRVANPDKRGPFIRLVQVADVSGRIFVFDLLSIYREQVQYRKQRCQPIPMDNVCWWVPNILLEFITSSKYAKVTHSLDCEDAALDNTLGVYLTNAIDIRKQFAGRGLAYISGRVLGFLIDKTKRDQAYRGIHGIWHILRIVTQVSDAIVLYAAMDAWITLLCYLGLLVITDRDVSMAQVIKWSFSMDPFHSFTEQCRYSEPVELPKVFNEFGDKWDDNPLVLPDFVPDCDDDTGRALALESIPLEDELKWWIEEHYRIVDNVWGTLQDCDIQWFVKEGKHFLQFGRKKILWPTVKPRWISVRLFDQLQEWDAFPPLQVGNGHLTLDTWAGLSGKKFVEISFLPEFRSQILNDFGRACFCPGGDGYVITYDCDDNDDVVLEMERQIAADMMAQHHGSHSGAVAAAVVEQSWADQVDEELAIVSIVEGKASSRKGSGLNPSLLDTPGVAPVANEDVQVSEGLVQMDVSENVGDDVL